MNEPGIIQSDLTSVLSQQEIDEIDHELSHVPYRSGAAIDALKIVSNGVNALRDPDRSFLIITHYQRLLNYIKPDFVHVLSDGKIVKTGDWKLALDLEKEGYGQFIN